MSIKTFIQFYFLKLNNFLYFISFIFIKLIYIKEEIFLKKITIFNLQELGYSDPKRWAFLVQSYIQLSFLQQQQNFPTNFNHKMVERSIYSARYCFVENLHRSGSMSGGELAVLDSWFDWITKYLLDPIDLIGRCIIINKSFIYIILNLTQDS